MAPRSCEETRALLPVDQAVVKGQAQRHDLAQGDLILVLPRHLPDRADGQDGCLARVQDGRAGVNPEDPDVCDGEGAAGEGLGARLPGPGRVPSVQSGRVREVQEGHTGPRP